MLIVSQQQTSTSLPNKPHPNIFYIQVQKELQVHDYFNFLLKLEQPKNEVTKLITTKMRTKLFNWLEKIALHTFNFSAQTLITASTIIDQYLAKTNQAPNTLQLIGCTGLLLASKLKEEIIVDPQCYVTASCNMFSKKQLLEKEKTLYGFVDWKKVRGGSLYGLRLGSQILKMDEIVKIFQKFLWNCLKDEEISQWKQAKIVYSVLSFMMVDPEHKLQVKSSLNLIKQF